MSELPALARLAVRLTVRRAWREAFLGDLEESMAEDIRRGVPSSEARRRVRRDALHSIFDALWPSIEHPPKGAESAPERPQGDPPVTAFLTDLRFAARGLRRTPTFAAVVVATLALGIGCVTAFWGLLDAVLLRPLPYPEPERLVQLWGEHVERPGGRWNSSHPDYLDIRNGTDAFAELAVYQSTFANLLQQGVDPERVPTMFVSHDFFDTLGLPMTLGRDFEAEDDVVGADATVILGHGLWQRRFGGADDVLGQTLRVDSVPRTVIGVAPPRVDDSREESDLWVPVTSLSGITIRGVNSLKVIGRLAPGVTLARANIEVGQVAERLREAYPDVNAQVGKRVDPLHESMVGQVRPRLLLVSAAAALLLLVVCANVSSLLLERSTRRRREMATRAALGASHGQLLRHFCAESVLLVGAGALGSVAVAWIVRRLLLDFGPPLPRHVDPSLDLRTLTFAIAVTAIVGSLFAIIPGLHALGRDLFQRLSVGQVGAEGQSSGRWRAAFVVTQVAMAVVLTLGAALLTQSMNKLYDVDLGYQPGGILTAELEVSTRFVSDEWPATVAFYEALIERLEATPGVASASAAHHHPAKPGWDTSFQVAGEPEPEPGFRPEASFRPVALGYFETVGIPLLRGRVFDDTTPSAAPGQVVVNQAFVDTHLDGDENPVGRRLIRDNWWIDEITEYTILGVVGDVRFAGRHRPPRPALYFTHRQDVPPMMTLLVRAEEGLDPMALVPVVREAIWAIDPELPVGTLATLEALVADTVSVRRFTTWLLGAFAVVTLALAALGLYGSLAFTTARRTREIGLRMALGARAADLQAMVLGQGLKLAAVGLALGLGAAWMSTRALEAFLFGIERSDPATFVGVIALLAAISLVAGWLPAWRATQVDPCRALADE